MVKLPDKTAYLSDLRNNPDRAGKIYTRNTEDIILNKISWYITREFINELHIRIEIFVLMWPIL